MAWFPIAAAAVSMVMQISSAGKANAGAQQAAQAAELAGQRQQQSDKFQADQMEVQAGQELAASQRAAQEQRRQAAFVASRAVAVAGASGGGVTDPTVANLIGDIQGEGAYRSALKIYQGEDNARQLRMGADAKTFEGSVAVENAGYQADAYRTRGQTGMLSAVGSAFGTGASLFGKYGMGGPTSSKSALTGNGWMDAGTDIGSSAGFA